MGGKNPIKDVVRVGTGVMTSGQSESMFFGPEEARAKQARAANAAANAQQRQAQQNYDLVAGIVNPATVAGLASFDRDIANQEKNLSRQEQLISQLDPTVIEASQQALKLLRGEQSSTLGPLKAQRDMQRQKLLNTLREQLGPGAETSTAGIQALTRFDSETSNIFAGAQQQAISNLGNVGSQFNSQRPDMFREIMGLSQFGQGKTQLQYQQAGMLGNAANGLQQTAGAQYTGDMLKAQGQLGMYNQINGVYNQIQGAAIQAGTGGLGAMKPTAGAASNSGTGASLQAGGYDPRTVA